MEPRATAASVKSRVPWEHRLPGRAHRYRGGMSQLFLILTTTEDDWERVRELRIENATDNPISYGATLKYTLQMTESDWRLRAKRGDGIDSTSVVAIERASGRWVGMMSAQHDDADGTSPILTGVYVTPDFRGPRHGIADTLLEHVVDWAARRSPTLRSYVYEDAVPAIRFYSRQSFHPPGRHRPLQLLGDRLTGTPSLRLLEMTRALQP